MTTAHMPNSSPNAGLLFLRLAAGAALTLFIAKHSADHNSLFFSARHFWLLAVLAFSFVFLLGGIFTRLAAACAAFTWALAACGELRAGQTWVVQPVRDCEFVFLFAALAVAGPGRFSAAHWLKSRTESRRNNS